MKKVTVLFTIAILFIFYSKAQSQKQMPSLNHIAIHIHDLKKSVAFYQNIVQLDTIPNPFNDGRHVFFKTGEHSQLHIVAGAEKNVVHYKYDHLCFTVNSLEDFIKHLNKENIIYEDYPGIKKAINLRPDGVKQIYFQDPDGYWIEINDDKY